MKSTPNTQARDIAPKTVQRSTYYQSLAITFLVTGIIGIISGYFATMNIQSQAREAVIKDMHVVSKDQQR